MNFGNFFSEFEDPFANDPFFNGGFGGRQRDQRQIQNTDEFGMPMMPMSPFGQFGQLSQMPSMFGSPFAGMQMENHFFENGSDMSQIHVDSGPQAVTLTLEIKNLDGESVDFHIDPQTKMFSISGSVTKRNGNSVFSQSFNQSVSLPCGSNEILDDKNVKLDYTNNVLTLVIPKVVHKEIGYGDNTEHQRGQKYISDKVEELE